MFNIPEPAIPFGSWFVISGVSGFIGSHIADQTLAAGYRVRGTTRSIQKSAWVEEYFKRKYGLDHFKLVEVPGMAANAAFDEVTAGAAGFIHVANDMTGSTDPQIAIPRAVDGALNALRASANESTMERFVYTSSSFAAALPRPGEVFTVKADTFYEDAVKGAWEPDPRPHTVYSASKIAAERAICDWIDSHKSSLVVNFLLPNANIGHLISSSNQGYPTSAGWVKALWDSDYDSLKNAPPQHYINVQDDAKLHAIALTHPGVQRERIFAMAGPVTLGKIVDILRKLYPNKEWEDLPEDGEDLSIVEPIQRAEDLLKAVYGAGFVNLVDSIKANATDLGS